MEPTTESVQLITFESASVVEDKPIISKEQFEIIEKICSQGIEPVICAIGVACNIISLVVFSHPKTTMKKSSKVFMMALCMFDIIYLLTALFQLILEAIQSKYSLVTVSKWLAYQVKYVQPFRRGASGGSSYMVVVISLERFIAIWFPLSRARSTYDHPWIFISIVTLLHSSFCAFIFFLFDPVQKLDDFWVARLSVFGLKIFKIYALFAEVIYRLIPVTFVAVFNLLTVGQLYAARKNRKSITSQDSKASSNESQATRMLLGVTFLFLICIIPSFIGGVINIGNIVNPTPPTSEYSYKTFQVFSRVLVRINSSANLLVYVVASTTFRNVLKAIFGKQNVSRTVSGASVSQSGVTNLTQL